MYKSMIIISFVVRLFFMPNPFEALGAGATTISPFVLNLIAELVLHTLTFAVVGLYYGGGSRGWGSFLYLGNYCVHTFILWLMSSAGFAIGPVLLILFVYVVSHMALAFLWERVVFKVRMVR